MKREHKGALSVAASMCELGIIKRSKSSMAKAVLPAHFESPHVTGLVELRRQDRQTNRRKLNEKPTVL
ncbi:hypothetical protein [Arenimonas oryziterrae]|uniref:hypothetical protein n=1 Tax=Arenimonas oryziterrae TaxID=498055 RepID=UPI0012E0B3DD|nr:hypothetical protein [Arenimonas oryziterrae]